MRAPQPDRVWILASAVPAAELLRARLSATTATRVFELTETGTFPSSAPLPRDIHAVVIVLDAAAIRAPALTAVVEACVREVVRRDEFRLFVWLRDLTIADLREEPTLSSLLERVHLIEDIEVDTVAQSVNAFLGRVRDIRFTAWTRRVSLWVDALLWAGASLFLLAGLLAIVGSLVLSAAAMPIDATAAVLGLEAHGLVVLLAAPILPLLLLAALLATHAGSIAQRASSAMVSLLVAVGAVILLRRIDPIGPFVWLGLSAGVLAEHLRRTLDSVRWQVALFDQDSAGGSMLLRRLVWFFRSSHRAALPAMLSRDTLDADLLEACRRWSPKPWSHSLFGRVQVRVFISYARETWSRQLAVALAKELELAGAEPFLDRDAIELGSNWPSVLRHRLVDSDIVIAIVESATMTREWPAWELSAALRGRELTGQPEPILLVHAALPDELPADVYPVMRALLTKRVPVMGAPRRIRVDDSTVATLARSLSPGRQYFPGALPDAVGLTLQSLVLPIVGVGLAAGLVGDAALLLLVAGGGGVLLEPSRIVIVALLMAYWFGFGTRTVLSRLTAAPLTSRLAPEGPFRLSGARDARDRARRNDRVPAIAATGNAVGLVGLVATWGFLAPHLEPLWIGWSCVACLAGWPLANVVIGGPKGRPA